MSSDDGHIAQGKMSLEWVVSLLIVLLIINRHRVKQLHTLHPLLTLYLDGLLLYLSPIVGEVIAYFVLQRGGGGGDGDILYDI